MTSHPPDPISAAELRRRRARALWLARDVGFVGPWNTDTSRLNRAVRSTAEGPATGRTS